MGFVVRYLNCWVLGPVVFVHMRFTGVGMGVFIYKHRRIILWIKALAHKRSESLMLSLTECLWEFHDKAF